MSSKTSSKDHDFGRLFVKYQPRMYGYIRSLVANRTDAEEILQETASVLWRKFDQFEPGTNFLAWALKVARYEVLHFKEKQGRDVLRFSEPFVDAVAEETVAASDRLGDLREALITCLDKLPAHQRNLFRRRYQSAATTRSVARELGRPPTTVYNALARIRRRLAECVERTLAREGAR